jgi:hypothetical protein
MDRTVTEDQTLVLRFTAETKQQSAVWKHPSSPVRKNFCWCSRSSGIAQEHSGWILHHEVLESTRTAIGVAIRRDRPADTRGHCGPSTMATPGLMWQTELPPEYGHWDGRLWSMRRTVQTSSPVTTTGAVHWRMSLQPRGSFPRLIDRILHSGISKLVVRWDKWPDRGGDYVEG